MVELYLPWSGLLVLVILYSFLSNNVLALSASFPRQEITDPSNDWKLLLSLQNTALIQNQSGNTVLDLSRNEKACLSDHQYMHPFDIQGVTYLKRNTLVVWHV
jgi:hypothetical protein